MRPQFGMTARITADPETKIASSRLAVVSCRDLRL
jgi:hypothetical protein